MFMQWKYYYRNKAYIHTLSERFHVIGLATMSNCENYTPNIHFTKKYSLAILFFLIKILSITYLILILALMGIETIPLQNGGS